VAERTLKVNIIGDAASVSQAFQEAGQESDGFGTKLGNLVKGGIALATGAAIGLGGALVGAALKTANHADEVAKSARQAGVSAEAYQELEYALGQTGIEQSTLNQLLERNTQRMGMAVEGNEKFAKAYEHLGVEVVDVNGNLRASEDVFDDVMRALAEIEDPALRAAAAGELLGVNAGRELAGALDQGIEGIDAARDRAHELGIVLGEDTLAQAEAFNDGIDNIKRALGGMVTSVGAEVLPGLLPLVETFADRLPGALSIATGFFNDTLLPGIRSAVDWIVPNVETLAGIFMETALPAIQDFASLAADFLTGTLLPAAEDLLNWVLPKLQDLGGWLLDVGLPAVQEFATSVAEFFTGTVLPAAQDLLDWLLPKLDAFQEWFLETAIPATLETIGDAFRDLMERAEPVMDFLRDNKDAVLVGLATALTAVVVPAFIAWTASVYASVAAHLAAAVAWAAAYLPIIAILAAVGIAAGLLYKAWQSNFLGIQDHTRRLWNTIRPILQQVWNRLSAFIDDILPELLGAWESLRDGVNTAVRFIWNRVIQPVFRSIARFIDDHSDTIMSVLEGAWTVIESTVTTAMDVIEGVIRLVLALIQGDWDAAWDAIKSTADSVWSHLRTMIELAIGMIRWTIDTIMSRIETLWEDAWNGIKRIAETTWDGIRTFISNGKQAMINVLVAPFEWFRDTFTWDTITDAATAAWDKINEYIDRGKQAMIDVLKAPFEWLRSHVGDIMRGAGNFAIDQANNMLDGLSTLLDGLVSAVNWIGDKLSIDALANLSAPSLPRIDRIPAFARGGTMAKTGLAVVGEEGAEIVVMPGGAQVIPADQTRSILQGVDGPMPDMGKVGGDGCLLCAMGLHDHESGETLGVGWGRIGDALSGAWDGITDAAGWVANLPREALDWIRGGLEAAFAEVLERFPINLELPGIFADLATAMVGHVRDGLRNLLSNLFREAEEEMAATSQSPVELGGWHQPTVGVITQRFGHTAFSRSSGWYGSMGHTGIDIANASGTPIWAANDGSVTGAGWMGGYGNTVILKHAEALETLYAHMRRILVRMGELVMGGQQIGEMGTTGASTGDHLHFELRRGGTPIDPTGTVPFARGGELPEDIFGVGPSGTSYLLHRGETVVPRGDDVTGILEEIRDLLREARNAKFDISLIMEDEVLGRVMDLYMFDQQQRHVPVVTP
jgi:phage-related protein